MSLGRGEGYVGPLVPDASVAPMPTRLLSLPAMEHFSNGGDVVASVGDTDWCGPFPEGWEDSIVVLNTSEVFDDFVPEASDDVVPQRRA